ncbi:hypothetical protein BY996DRAFT_6484520 [Phakopsora pachyrhizi]|nr:hypothetical protein BY996DRAFT_6484520 [Phakopsora pachyrhizi]
MPTDRSIPPTDPISTWDNNYNLPVETDSYFNEKFGMTVEEEEKKISKRFLPTTSLNIRPENSTNQG